jgi:hypothetical protein
MLTLPRSLADAKASGQRFYFTGKPCPKGHVAERNVRRGECMECLRGYVIVTVRRWRSRHPEAARLRNAAVQARRHAAKLRRIPPWADLSAIALFYAGCPPGHHVDHGVPLQAENASGLHVLENLQYLPATDNLRKQNYFEGDWAN